MPGRHRLHLIASFCLVLPLTSAVLGSADEPQTFSPQELQADLAEIEAAIARIHPGVSHSVDPAELTRAVAAVRAGLNRRATRDEAWQALAKLNPVLADGHLVVTFPDGANSEVSRHLQSGGLLFPFNVHVDAHGELFIRSKSNDEPTPLAGARIEAIDGMPGAEISRTLLGYLNGDTPALRAALLSLRFPLFYWKVFGDRRSYRLKVAGVETRVDGSGDLPSAHSEGPFERLFRFELHGTKRAVLTVGSFFWADKSKFYELTKDAFTRMRAAGTQTLIIDIRANTGGDDDMWIEGIMPYIATKPFRNGSDYVLKVIEGRQGEGQKVGDVVRKSQSTVYPSAENNPLRFQGKVYVLIGPATYSSAILFTTAAQDNGFATIAGTGSAARGTQSGGTQIAKLPNTQLRLVVPRFVLKRASGVEGLVQPDIMVPEDPFRPATAIKALLRR